MKKIEKELRGWSDAENWQQFAIQTFAKKTVHVIFFRTNKTLGYSEFVDGI